MKGKMGWWGGKARWKGEKEKKKSNIFKQQRHTKIVQEQNALVKLGEKFRGKNSSGWSCF